MLLCPNATSSKQATAATPTGCSATSSHGSNTPLETWLLQELNAIPFPVVVANCVAWVGYGIVTKDPYVFLANDPGLLLGLFYTFSAYGYADVKVWRIALHSMLLQFTVR